MATMDRDLDAAKRHAVWAVEKCLEMIAKALDKGFHGNEASVLGGHLNFAFMAATGRVGRAFTRDIMGAKPCAGRDLHTQPRVYDALFWCQALLQRFPPRIELSAHPARAMLITDGYWDMGTSTGGIGAILLHPATQPQVYGTMLLDYLRQHLQSAPAGDEAKKQLIRKASLRPDSESDSECRHSDADSDTLTH